MRSACAPEPHFASLHVDVAISLGDVVDSAFDTVLAGHV
jgi:hypothetical protein